MVKKNQGGKYMKLDVMIKLENYLRLFKEEAERFSLLQKQIQEKQDILNRKNFNGHITASGLVISPDNSVLVIFHNKLQKFLQPGGHIEDIDNHLIESAMREVREETGLNNINIHPWCKENDSPIMIDTHYIPANERKKEDNHFHHDFMFVFTTAEKDIILDKKEVSDFSWVEASRLVNNDSLIAKALQKLNKINYQS